MVYLVFCFELTVQHYPCLFVCKTALITARQCLAHVRATAPCRRGVLRVFRPKQLRGYHLETGLAVADL